MIRPPGPVLACGTKRSGAAAVDQWQQRLRGTAAHTEQRHFGGGDSNSCISKGIFSMVRFWSKSEACSLRQLTNLRGRNVRT